MRPTKLSSKVFLEFPPVLAHYLQADRNLWIDGNPKRGRISLLNRSGNFIELDALAVERRQLIQMLGKKRARALKYRTGFEQGRQDGARQFESFSENARLALQAALVFGQLQGRFIVEPITFEFDLDAGTLYREIKCHSCVEAVIHRMTLSDAQESVCWGTAGYLSGHMSEILARNVITFETECVANGGECCRFISRLDHEFGSEVEWVHESMAMNSLDDELAKRNRLIVSAQKAARRAQTALGSLRKRVRSELLLDNIIARSQAMEASMRRTRHLCTTKAPILISGEPGTGKETLARAIHGASDRRERPFVQLDCRATSGDLIHQEIFGYEKETVPGMREGHLGALSRAEGGTLFIEEITAMSSETQEHLLDSMNKGEYQSIGADLPSPMDIRIVAGMQGDPKKAVADGTLDESLYYALAIGRIDLPPLRDRGPDIIPLAEKFLQDAKTRHGRAESKMSDEFKEVLLGCAWPGNLRQLNTVVEHAVLMSSDKELRPESLPDEILADRWTREPKELTEEVIRAALNRTRNNRSKAAELLGVGRTTLWRAMKRLDVA